MDQRQAKKEACRDMGRMTLQVIEEGMGIGYGFDSARDNERYQDAMTDLAHELLRRGGVRLDAPEVDERQLELEIDVVLGAA